MNLSPHITLEELTNTNHVSLLDDNRLGAEKYISSARVLAETLLEPIRVHFGAPLIVHSGYRSKALNTAIGGAKNSQHMLGEAADLHIQGVDLVEVYQWIWKESGLHWGQLIIEGNKAGSYGWIHISLGSPFRSLEKSNQVLSYQGGYYSRYQ